MDGEGPTAGDVMRKCAQALNRHLLKSAIGLNATAVRGALQAAAAGKPAVPFEPWQQWLTGGFRTGLE